MTYQKKNQAILTNAYNMTIGDLNEFYCLSCLPREEQKVRLANFRSKWELTNEELLILYKVVEFIFEDAQQYLEGTGITSNQAL
ncbi:MAG: hypothetical protein LPH21_12510 [Shewanella sp.]|nr:hypothetical protein [Shewanella sp.]